MTATTFDATIDPGAPRRAVEDAWRALNRRYAIGTGVLVALLLLLWTLGVGPGAWRAAQPGPGTVPGATTGAATATAPSALPSTSPAGTSAGMASPGSGAAASGAGSGAAASAGGAPGGRDAAPRDGSPATGIVPAMPKPLPGAPVARVYFEPDQAWPSGELGPRLAPVLARLKAEPDTQALVSGFHDRRGSAERNEALALRRAQAVRRVLIREGVTPERIVLAKPQQTQGSGPDREARRVEVTVAR